MKKSLLFSLPLAVGALVAAGPVLAHDHKKSKGDKMCAKATPAALDARFAEFNAAWATKNPDTVTALFDDDAVLLATGAARPRTTPADIRDYFVSFLKASPVGKIDTSTVKHGCNWALQAGTWTVTLTDPASGAKNDVKARYTFLYQYEDGQWKIEHLHSSVLPANP
ncbi:MAG: SgcJ/EcaC family oxidoreductase [Cypionkella sp.]